MAKTRIEVLGFCVIDYHGVSTSGLNMPHFFVDTSDQVSFIRDESGHQFVDVEAAKCAAVDALADMARDRSPNNDAQVFLAVIRDEGGHALFQASLTLKIGPYLAAE